MRVSNKINIQAGGFSDASLSKYQWIKKSKSDEGIRPSDFLLRVLFPSLKFHAASIRELEGIVGYVYIGRSLDSLVTSTFDSAGGTVLKKLEASGMFKIFQPDINQSSAWVVLMKHINVKDLPYPDEHGTISTIMKPPDEVIETFYAYYDEVVASEESSNSIYIASILTQNNPSLASSIVNGFDPMEEQRNEVERHRESPLALFSDEDFDEGSTNDFQDLAYIPDVSEEYNLAMAD